MTDLKHYSGKYTALSENLLQFVSKDFKLYTSFQNVLTDKVKPELW